MWSVLRSSLLSRFLVPAALKHAIGCLVLLYSSDVCICRRMLKYPHIYSNPGVRAQEVVCDWFQSTRVKIIQNFPLNAPDFLQNEFQLKIGKKTYPQTCINHTWTLYNKEQFTVLILQNYLGKKDTVHDDVVYTNICSCIAAAPSQLAQRMCLTFIWTKTE